MRLCNIKGPPPDMLKVCGSKRFILEFVTSIELKGFVCLCLSLSRCLLWWAKEV